MRRLLHAAPMFHVADLAGWVTQSLVGGTHVMVPKFDPVEVMSAIQRHRVTNTVLVPTMIQLLVDHPDLEAYDLTSLRTILYGGSAPGAALLRRAMKAFPQADFVQGYGMTELAPFATVLTADDHRGGAAWTPPGGRPPMPRCGSSTTATRSRAGPSARSRCEVAT
jgi:acyl-CoA synthetase (AMP-forming)/AMP-acid ligase II